MSLFHIISESDSFKSIKTVSDQRVQLTGLNLTGFALASAVIAEHTNRPVCLVCPTLELAEKCRDDLEVLVPEKLGFFPSEELLPFDLREPNSSLVSLRIETLLNLKSKKNPIIVTESRALFKKLTPPETFYSQGMELNVGDDVPFKSFISTLVNYGYEREDTVERVGVFSVRGGIIDVYSWTLDLPVRIEFWGDEIESVRTFDLVSQRSIETVSNLKIYPNLLNTSGCASLLDYLESPILFLYEPEAIEDRMTLLQQEAFQILESKEKPPSLFDEHYFTPSEVMKKLSENQTFNYQLKKDDSCTPLQLNIKPDHPFRGDLNKFITELKSYQTHGIRPILLCDNRGQKERLIDILDEYESFQPEVFQGALHEGVSLKADGIEFVNEHEIFNRFKRRKPYKKFKRAEALRSLSTMNFGDYVVHVDYGIGQFKGLQTISLNNAFKECLQIEYQDGDKVYVSIDRIHKVQRYSSEDGAVPKLTKLGSNEWDRIKQKTKKQIEVVAKELVELYAQRSLSKGFSYSIDGKWQREMEAAFDFEDTVDQAKATFDVKEDMQAIKPMDRLICGDVGFGKTEIAIRAAFKAVMDSKQVVVLVPTTILAQQHYETFTQRLVNFPLSIGQLSRFRTSTQQKKTAEQIVNGEIDIVIGTHRVLSEDIKFKDLGLIIVDEEQRFGVKHKERMKEMKFGVDVLTLSATPIPRTLHQSLVGVRSISNIETPPVNRLPILTEIISWDEDKIYTAITREVERGGQVFFVHNRVQTIDQIKTMIEKIVPKVRVCVGHGQMKERELEKVMIDFKDRKFDVLLATMIIENGLDIPNANTILINRADRFGLSQLYQLRGRVGRSDHQAYAYLIAPSINKMTDISRKRLEALEEYSELGSGMKISLRDLELRGAGSLLGTQQSGHIDAVGYDLYLETLEDAVSELKYEVDGVTEATKKKIETQFEVDLDAMLSEDYISNPRERITLYYRLVHCQALDEIKDIETELKDRFGRFPDAVHALVTMIKIRFLAHRISIKKVEVTKQIMVLIFDESIGEIPQKAQRLMQAFMTQTFAEFNFRKTKSFGVNIKLKGDVHSVDKLEFALGFMEQLEVQSEINV